MPRAPHAYSDAPAVLSEVHGVLHVSDAPGAAPLPKEGVYRLEHAARAGREALLAEVAACQRGAISHRQLSALGLGRGAIHYRVSKGRLHPLYRAVYLLGHRVPAPLAREAGAVLACGEGALLSHTAVARVLGLWQEAGEIDVTVPGRQLDRQPGLSTHTTRALNPRDITHLHGVPATTGARMYLDLAEQLTLRELEPMLAEGLRRRLVTMRQLHELLSRSQGRRGAPTLRALLVRERGPAFIRSEAEWRLLDLVRRGGLPLPETNVRFGAYELDFLWRDAGLVIEVDGYAYHRGRAAFERDRRRDAQLQAHGLAVMRVTWLQLTEEPEALLVRIAQALVARRAA